MENVIVFVGNTGVGKSFLCNEIFELCNSSHRFKSAGTVSSVTGTNQQGQIDFEGQRYTIADTPGFFDVKIGATEQESREADGQNVGKLVKSLEDSREIYAVVFVFCDRFSTPHKLWYNRIVEIIGSGYQGCIVLLHNKQNDLTREEELENEMDIKHIVGSPGGISYLTVSMQQKGVDGKLVVQNQLKKLLSKVANFVPFTCKNLKIPDMCYDKEESDEPFEKEISNDQTDEGHTVINKKDGSYYTTEKMWHPNPIMKVLGSKVPVQVFHERMVEEEVHVKKEVTTRVVGVFQKVYKVRFDGSRDFVREVQLSQRVERY